MNFSTAVLIALRVSRCNSSHTSSSGRRSPFQAKYPYIKQCGIFERYKLRKRTPHFVQSYTSVAHVKLIRSRTPRVEGRVVGQCRFRPEAKLFRSGRALAASATPRRHRESRNPVACFQLHCIAYVLMTVKLQLWRSKTVYLLRSKPHSIFRPQSITVVCILLLDVSMNAQYGQSSNLMY